MGFLSYQKTVTDGTGRSFQVTIIQPKMPHGCRTCPAYFAITEICVLMTVSIMGNLSFEYFISFYIVAARCLPRGVHFAAISIFHGTQVFLGVIIFFKCLPPCGFTLGGTHLGPWPKTPKAWGNPLYKAYCIVGLRIYLHCYFTDTGELVPYVRDVQKLAQGNFSLRWNIDFRLRNIWINPCNNKCL